MADVVEYLIEHKIHASPKLIEHIADTIIKYFKSEVKVCLNNNIYILTINFMFTICTY